MSDPPQDVHRGSSVDPVESETNQNNADSFSPTPSSGPIDEQQVWAGRGDVTGGRKGSKGHKKRHLEAPTNEKESGEPGDHAVQPETTMSVTVKTL